MNELTEMLVRKSAKRYKALAKRNDSDFRQAVRIEHWNLMVDRYGAGLKQRAMALMSLFRPEFFDEDGYIHEFADLVFNLDHRLSWLAVQVMERKVARETALQLYYDWGDLPVMIADPQLRMF
jgi:hypothetical protein